MALMLSGRVVPGRGDGRFFMSLEGYQKQFLEKLGTRLFDGTLNLSCNPVERKMFIQSLPAISIASFQNDGSFFGSAKAYRIVANGVRGCFIIAPVVSFHDESTLEIGAPFNLREKLNVKDGDEIVVGAD